MSKQMLSKKVCVISGAGKGIGRDIAKLFYEEGANIALITRTLEDLHDLKNEAGFDDARVLLFKGDVSDESTVSVFYDSVISKFGRADVLINNAGMRFRRSFMEISKEDFDNVINTNLGSVFLMCKYFGQSMIQNKSGKIVNMASVVGSLGLADLSAYGASKGGIISLTKCLAIEWAKYGINVNSIAPGFCETSYAENFKKKEDLYGFTLERTPQGKWGSGKNIADACLFLSSSMSDYITGEILNVDGGWSAW